MPTGDKKRCFTILIVPHSEEATYSIRIPLYLLQVAVGLLVLFVAGVSVLGFAYFRAASEAQEAYALRQLNRAQQEEINALAVETQRMMEQIQAIDELVDFVRNKLDLDEEVINGVLQGSDAGEPNPVNTVSEDYRFYSSRYSTGGILERTTENIALLQEIVPERSEALDAFGEYIDHVQAKPSIWPTRGRLASGFGMRRIPYASSGYQFHNGVDIIGSYGSAVWAAANGEVVFTGYRGSLGNLIIIDHGYDYETYYAHLSDFAVTVGDYVKRGQTIGYMGASGRTTGVHLHYEVHVSGSPVNPYNYMAHD